MKLSIYSVFFLLPCIIAARDTSWWKNTILYEIFIWSFKDSNGDGIGDLNGITQKLDHFVDLNIETIYISPFFESPMLDMGYDISNYTAVDPLFGTLQDFERLMAATKKRGLKVVSDLVINHSSDEHPWFQKSIDKVDPYTDYYVWADPKGYDAKGNPLPPNNWISLFKGSAWEWNDKRKQFYLHQFAIKQPDLNLRNEQLKNEIKNMLKFWLDMGVSGFRLDATKHYIEDKLLRDEPIIIPRNKDEELMYDDMDHIYTADLWESYEFIHELRQFIDEYTEKRGDEFEKLLAAEVYTTENYTLAYYGTKDYPLTHFPFNFVFVGLIKVEPAQTYNKAITTRLQRMPIEATPNWMAENHDQERIGTKLGDEYMDIVVMSMLTLPGVACIYYGQEIGMKNYRIRLDQRKDPNINSFTGATRDGERLPMQWDSSLNAGFSSNDQTWLPINPNYWTVNVEDQKATKHSRYNMFKILSKLRKSKTMKYGNFTSYVLSKWVYSHVRSCNKCKPYIFIANLGTETEFFDLHDAIPNLPSTLEVVAASLNAGYKFGDSIKTAPKFPHIFVMRPTSAVLLTEMKRRNYEEFEDYLEEN